MTTPIDKLSQQNRKRDQKAAGKRWNSIYGGYFGNKKNARKFVQTILPFIPRQKKLRILYPCAGNGLLGEELVQALHKKNIPAELVLIDISNRQLRENQNPKTRKIYADILKLRLKQVFDVVIMRSSLDYFWTLRAQKKVLSKIRHWLSKKGIFFNQIAALPTISERNLADEIYRCSRKLGRRHFQCPVDLKKLYQKAGFWRVTKIGQSAPLALRARDHQERYGIGKNEIEKIRKIIVRKNLQSKYLFNTKTDYHLKFIFPIYKATSG